MIKNYSYMMYFANEVVKEGYKGDILYKTFSNGVQKIERISYLYTKELLCPSGRVLIVVRPNNEWFDDGRDAIRYFKRVCEECLSKISGYSDVDKKMIVNEYLKIYSIINTILSI